MLVRTSIIPTLVVILLLIGALASWQRNEFKHSTTTCNSGARVALTVVAGPLNYLGVNPKPNCSKVHIPRPSK